MATKATRKTTPERATCRRADLEELAAGTSSGVVCRDGRCPFTLWRSDAADPDGEGTGGVRYAVATPSQLAHVLAGRPRRVKVFRGGGGESGRDVLLEAVGEAARPVVHVAASRPVRSALPEAHVRRAWVERLLARPDLCVRVAVPSSMPQNGMFSLCVGARRPGLRRWAEVSADGLRRVLAGGEARVWVDGLSMGEEGRQVRVRLPEAERAAVSGSGPVKGQAATLLDPPVSRRCATRSWHGEGNLQNLPREEAERLAAAPGVPAGPSVAGRVAVRRHLLEQLRDGRVSCVGGFRAGGRYLELRRAAPDASEARQPDALWGVLWPEECDDVLAGRAVDVRCGASGGGARAVVEVVLEADAEAPRPARVGARVRVTGGAHAGSEGSIVGGDTDPRNGLAGLVVHVDGFATPTTYWGDARRHLEAVPAVPEADRDGCHTREDGECVSPGPCPHKRLTATLDRAPLRGLQNGERSHLLVVASDGRLFNLVTDPATDEGTLPCVVLGLHDLGALLAGREVPARLGLGGPVLWLGTDPSKADEDDGEEKVEILGPARPALTRATHALLVEVLAEHERMMDPRLGRARVEKARAEVDALVSR